MLAPVIPLWVAVLGCRHQESDGLGDAVDLVAAIDPFIATAGVGYDVGCATPAASWPMGLVKVGPDTADAGGSAMGFYRGGGYYFDDPDVQGFSHLHVHGTGLAAYGSIAFMPVALDAGVLSVEQTSEAGYRAALDKSSELASAGSYKVRLEDPAVAVELAVTQHTAVHEYTFDAGVTSPGVLVDLGHVIGSGTVPQAEIALDPIAGEMSGSMTNAGDLGDPVATWFVAAFDPPPDSFGVWEGEEGQEIAVEPSATKAERVTKKGGHVRVGAWFGWAQGTQVRARVALSGTGTHGAEINFAAEHTGFDVEATAQAAREEWARWLAPVRVWGGSADDQTIFATALYHTLQMPTRWSDVDGSYRGLDDAVHASVDEYASDFSLWDTYRTAHPLYTLLWPDTQRMLLSSLARMAQDGGNVPRWPLGSSDSGSMVGVPGHIVWAEAYQKGLRDFGEDVLADTAERILVDGEKATVGDAPDVHWLQDPGYYPEDAVGRSVAWTLEMAIAGHALAEVMDDLGHGGATAALTTIGSDWENLYDDETGWLQGRTTEGDWVPLHDEAAWDDVYAEGNARQYAWLVPQDPAALFERMGGPDAAADRLEEFMDETRATAGDTTGVPGDWYWHGNEPDLHAPWLFALAGRPDLTREWVAWVRDAFYGTGPDGLAGNDDGGTLSAWLVFSDLGLYPLAGTDRYVLGDPLFDRIELDRADGTMLTLEREGDGGEVYVDGTETDVELTHAELSAADTIRFSFGE